MHPTHKRWFWVLMGLGIIAIVIGWSITIRDIVSAQAPVIREEISEKIEQAAGQVGKKGGAVIEAFSDISQTIDTIEEAYYAEKEQQEQSQQEQATE